MFIRWEDSRGCPMGWQLLDEARSTKASVIESVGWVMAAGRKAVQLAPHVSLSGAVQGHMVIPRSAFLAVEILRRV